MVSRINSSPFRDKLWVEQRITDDPTVPLGTGYVRNPKNKLNCIPAYWTGEYVMCFINMANSYTQIPIQAVFAVQNRISLINNNWKNELYKYITEVVQNHGHKVLQINGMPDHVHILIGLRPTQALADLMQMVKEDSSKWINTEGFVKGKFSWQSGYGSSLIQKTKCQG